MKSAPLHTTRVLYRLGYTRLTFSFLCWVSALLGRRACWVISTLVAKVYCMSQPAVIRVVARNLKLLGHPGKDAAQVIVNYAQTLADYFWLARQSPTKAFALADFDGMLPSLESGAILATGHFGFFEFGALALSQSGRMVSIVTNAEPTPEFTRWRADYRRRWGAETLELGYDTFSALRVAGAIRSGRLTAMLIDRPSGEHSVSITLPGGAIRFSMAPAILAWTTGCPIIPVVVRRTETRRYLIHTRPPITVDKNRPRQEALEECTRQIAQALVMEFQRDPLQWYHFIPLS